MARSAKDNTQLANVVVDRDFKDEIADRYLAYAISTITSRSLPDVRDGLKPVHRRLLYAMMELRLNPKSGFKKCARIVGDVMGKYHPHGDKAIYDAMVRLSQEFSSRYPLVDGQGNFGNIDGDNPAAMRYTEAKLTAIAGEMLKGINENSVDFRETYDGDRDEPVVLPSAVPNLLANGSSGIAVGMATNIPPHNVGELCSALLHLIKTPNTSIEKLCSFIKGPDFPTGGSIIEPEDVVIDAYKNGKGSFRIRAKWEKEDLGNGLWQIVINEIPYQVQKSRLIEKIADLIEKKKISILSDIRDESAEDIRLVIEPKTRNVVPEVLMEALFKNSDLESRFSLNMNVLSDKGRVPKVLNLREVLNEYLEHRHDVLNRRLVHRKENINHRLEILSGYLIAYLNIDEVIKIIREEDDPKAEMIKRFELTDLQADSILNMRLRALRKLEEFEIQKEYDGLSAELADILDKLGNEELRWNVISDEIKYIKKEYGQTNKEIGKRRTLVINNAKIIDFKEEDLIEKEPLTIVLSKNGWIRALKGHVDINDVKYKENDEGLFSVFAMSTDKIVVFSSLGKFFTLNADKLPGGRGHGDPIRLLIDMDANSNIVSMKVHKDGEKYLVASTDGKGFIVNSESTLAQTKNGKLILNVSKDVKAKVCVNVEGDLLAIVGTNRKLLVFDVSDVPEMNKGKGVILQKYRDSQLSDIKIFKEEEGLQWKMGERTRQEKDLRLWKNKRASMGKMPPMGFPKSNKFTY